MDNTSRTGGGRCRKYLGRIPVKPRMVCPPKCQPTTHISTKVSRSQLNDKDCILEDTLSNLIGLDDLETAEAVDTKAKEDFIEKWKGDEAKENKSESGKQYIREAKSLQKQNDKDAYDLCESLGATTLEALDIMDLSDSFSIDNVQSIQKETSIQPKDKCNNSKLLTFQKASDLRRSRRLMEVNDKDLDGNLRHSLPKDSKKLSPELKSISPANTVKVKGANLKTNLMPKKNTIHPNEKVLIKDDDLKRKSTDDKIRCKVKDTDRSFKAEFTSDCDNNERNYKRKSSTIDKENLNRKENKRRRLNIESTSTSRHINNSPNSAMVSGAIDVENVPKVENTDSEVHNDTLKGRNNENTSSLIMKSKDGPKTVDFDTVDNDNIKSPCSLTEDIEILVPNNSRRSHNSTVKSDHNDSAGSTKSAHTTIESPFSIASRTHSFLSTQEKLELYSWGLPEAVLERYNESGIRTMFPWQAECLGQSGVVDGRNLVYSAPTSAGKTLVAEILMLKRVLEEGKKGLFILPFVSVAREKMYYLQKMFGVAGVRVAGFMGSQNPPGGLSKTDIAVCTIEKANNLINRLVEQDMTGVSHYRKGKQRVGVGSIGVVVVDELHLVGDQHRGYLLELLLTKLTFLAQLHQNNSHNTSKYDNGVQIIGMSATLPNLPLLAKWLNNAALYTTSHRPVPLKETYKLGTCIYDADGISINQLNPDLVIQGDNEHISQMCLETVLSGYSVLIFCPTKVWCETLAVTIAKHFFNIGRADSKYPSDIREKLRSSLDGDGISRVLEALRSSPAGLDSILARSISFAAAYHHAGLTLDERDIIEGGFRTGSLRVLVATSTLCSGVNLPARRVIIRSLSGGGGSSLDSLTYKQMVGRAGRKGVDTQGESILICSNKSEADRARRLLTHCTLPAITSCLQTHNSLSASMKRAILEVIANGLATTLKEVNQYCSCTLLAASLTAQDKSRQEDNEHSSDVNSSQYSTQDSVTACLTFLEDNEFIRRQEDGESVGLVGTQLGLAVMASGLSPDEGLRVFSELRRARQCFVLEDELHIIYQVTPTYVSSGWAKLDWAGFLSSWEELGESGRRVGHLVGVQESFIFRAMKGAVNIKARHQAELLAVHQRFYTALALRELVQEVPIGFVAGRFGASKGALQALQHAAATFAGMVTVMCERLGWDNMALLLAQYMPRLHYGARGDLCDLLRLPPPMDAPTARHLHSAGLNTVAVVARAGPAVVEQVLHSATPFHSNKYDGSEGRVRQAGRIVLLVGGRPVTEAQAAKLIVAEARQTVQKDLGISGIDWSQDTKDPITSQNHSVNNGHTDKNTDLKVHFSAARGKKKLSPHALAILRRKSKSPKYSTVPYENTEGNDSSDPSRPQDQEGKSKSPKYSTIPHENTDGNNLNDPSRPQDQEVDSEPQVKTEIDKNVQRLPENYSSSNETDHRTASDKCVKSEAILRECDLESAKENKVESGKENDKYSSEADKKIEIDKINEMVTDIKVESGKENQEYNSDSKCQKKSTELENQNGKNVSCSNKKSKSAGFLFKGMNKKKKNVRVDEPESSIFIPESQEDKSDNVFSPKSRKRKRGKTLRENVAQETVSENNNTEEKRRLDHARGGQGQNTRDSQGQNSKGDQGQNAREDKGQNARDGQGQNSRDGQGQNSSMFPRHPPLTDNEQSEKMKPNNNSVKKQDNEREEQNASMPHRPLPQTKDKKQKQCLDNEKGQNASMSVRPLPQTKDKKQNPHKLVPNIVIDDASDVTEIQTDHIKLDDSARPGFSASTPIIDVRPRCTKALGNKEVCNLNVVSFKFEDNKSSNVEKNIGEDNSDLFNESSEQIGSLAERCGDKVRERSSTGISREVTKTNLDTSKERHRDSFDFLTESQRENLFLAMDADSFQAESTENLQKDDFLAGEEVTKARYVMNREERTDQNLQKDNFLAGEEVTKNRYVVNREDKLPVTELGINDDISLEEINIQYKRSMQNKSFCEAYADDMYKILSQNQQYAELQAQHHKPQPRTSIDKPKDRSLNNTFLDIDFGSDFSYCEDSFNNIDGLNSDYDGPKIYKKRDVDKLDGSYLEYNLKISNVTDCDTSTGIEDLNMPIVEEKSDAEIGEEKQIFFEEKNEREKHIFFEERRETERENDGEEHIFFEEKRENEKEKHINFEEMSEKDRENEREKDIFFEEKREKNIFFEEKKETERENEGEKHIFFEEKSETEKANDKEKHIFFEEKSETERENKGEEKLNSKEDKVEDNLADHTISDSFLDCAFDSYFHEQSICDIKIDEENRSKNPPKPDPNCAAESGSLSVKNNGKKKDDYLQDQNKKIDTGTKPIDMKIVREKEKRLHSFSELSITPKTAALLDGQIDIETISPIIKEGFKNSRTRDKEHDRNILCLEDDKSEKLSKVSRLSDDLFLSPIPESSKKNDAEPKAIVDKVKIIDAELKATEDKVRKISPEDKLNNVRSRGKKRTLELQNKYESDVEMKMNEKVIQISPKQNEARLKNKRTGALLNNSPSLVPHRNKMSPELGTSETKISRNAPGTSETSPAFNESNISVNNSLMNTTSLCIIDVASNAEVFSNFLDEVRNQTVLSLSLACQRVNKKDEKKGIGWRISHHYRSGRQSHSIKNKGITGVLVGSSELLVVGLAVCWGNRDAYYLNLRTVQEDTHTEPLDVSLATPPIAENVNLQMRLDAVREIIENKVGGTVQFWDARMVVRVAAAAGLGCVSGTVEDPRVAAWLLHPSDKEPSLHNLIVKYHPESLDVYENCGAKKTMGLGMDTNASHSARIRSAMECVAVFHLTAALRDKLDKERLLMAYTETEMPSVVSMAYMELNGMGFSNKECQEQKTVLETRLKAIESEAFKHSGQTFSLSSPLQISRVLYSVLRLPKSSSETSKENTVKGNRSCGPTHSKALQELTALHPLPGLILEWRKINATLTKVISPLQQAKLYSRPLAMDRVHPTAYTFTATGRITLHSPCLQSVPRDFTIWCIQMQSLVKEKTGRAGNNSTRGHLQYQFANTAVMNSLQKVNDGEYEEKIVSVRRALVAGRGRVLLAVDYCQLELRLLAHFSSDPNLLESFGEDKPDVFSSIAARLHGITHTDVNSDQRQKAKQICYGLLYGMGEHTLSEELGTTEEDARKFIHTFETMYPGAHSYLQKAVDKCREAGGLVYTLIGRHRHLPNIDSTDSYLRSQSERQAVNTQIQGSGADLVKLAAVRIEMELEQAFPTAPRYLTHPSITSISAGQLRGAYLVLHLHDELIYEVCEDDLVQVSQVIRRHMEQVWPLKVPLKVKLQMGQSWGTLQPYSL